MKKQFMTPLIIFGLLVVLLVVGLIKAKYIRDVPSPLIGKAVPQFTLPAVEELQTVSSEELKGQVSLINIWASWCVSCRAEHEVLNYAAQKEGLKIYGINYKDELMDARRWLKNRGNPYVKSAFDTDGLLGIDWGVYGVPETFVIDQKGHIRYKHTGPIYIDDLRNVLIPCIESLKSGQGEKCEK
ncbi:MAG: DsbE family thiol:disulfide interchange protein [Gammaproteobacteria bacterium]|nr:DsbE family thiol:disulfide interchange protein [Gammaproteobacteria bacterium]